MPPTDDAVPDQMDVGPSETEPVRVPVARLGAVMRGAIRGSAAVACALLTALIYRPLTWDHPDVGRLLVDGSIAIVAMPVPLLALLAAVSSLRWFALGLWPLKLGIHADARSLTLRFGPFGTRRYEAAGLRAVYPFETDDDPAEMGFEAFLPPDQQERTLMPHVTYGDEKVAVNDLILRFAAGSEQEVLSALRPVIQSWRQSRREPSDATNGSGV